jgi:Uma2 family endonuclease
MLKAAKKPRKKIRIGPEDDGRRMSLVDFDHAEVQEGYLYELGKGILEVSNVPKISHGKQVQEIRNQFVVYQIEHEGMIDYISGGSDAKLMIASSESERHPDLLIYCSAAPDHGDIWWDWIPEIVIEVVSESSRKRDYETKPDEYLEFGVREYWIVDGFKEQMTVLQRRGGQWKPQVIKSPRKYSPSLLPGFSLDLKRVFAASKSRSSK